MWYKLPKYSDGFVANWSERHIAYAAGLGTFGLNGGFITENGFNKIKCYNYSSGEESQNLQVPYGIKEPSDWGIGCGLCQTKVPCEYHSPF